MELATRGDESDDRHHIRRTHRRRLTPTYASVAPMALELQASTSNVEELQDEFVKLVQRNVLQLCRDHIAFVSTLQVMGVMCITVDGCKPDICVKLNEMLINESPASVTPTVRAGDVQSAGQDSLFEHEFGEQITGASAGGTEGTFSAGNYMTPQSEKRVGVSAIQSRSGTLVRKVAGVQGTSSTKLSSVVATSSAGGRRQPPVAVRLVPVVGNKQQTVNSAQERVNETADALRRRVSTSESIQRATVIAVRSQRDRSGMGMSLGVTSSSQQFGEATSGNENETETDGDAEGGEADESDSVGMGVNVGELLSTVNVDVSHMQVGALSKRAKWAVRHESPSPCPLCGVVFTRASDLDRHALKHFGIKPWKCTVCDEQFYRSDDAKAHAVKMHGLAMPEHSVVNSQKTALIEARMLLQRYRAEPGSIPVPHSALSIDQKMQSDVSADAESTTHSQHGAAETDAGELMSNEFAVSGDAEADEFGHVEPSQYDG